MKSLCLLLVLSLFCKLALGQVDQKVVHTNPLYIGTEFNYRSYGTNGIVGNGIAVEISQDLKKWLGVGVNLSYWNNEKIDWDFVNPINGDRFLYLSSIEEYKISPFAQFIPINTSFFDFIIKAGGRMGYYNQVFYEGGYGYFETVEIFEVDLRDIGYKGFNIGYELGIELRFQLNRLVLSPNMLFANDVEGNSFSALNFRLGYQLF